MQEALKKMEDCGAQTILDGTSKAKAEQLMSDEQLEAYKEFLSAKAYQSFAPTSPLPSVAGTPNTSPRP